MPEIGIAKRTQAQITGSNGNDPGMARDRRTTKAALVSGGRDNQHTAPHGVVKGGLQLSVRADRGSHQSAADIQYVCASFDAVAYGIRQLIRRSAWHPAGSRSVLGEDGPQQEGAIRAKGRRGRAAPAG